MTLLGFLLTLASLGLASSVGARLANAGQLVAQLIGVGALVGFVFTLGFVMNLGVDFFVGQRVSAKAELEGWTCPKWVLWVTPSLN